jgi:hypothetical protein
MRPGEWQHPLQGAEIVGAEGLMCSPQSDGDEAWLHWLDDAACASFSMSAWSQLYSCDFR